MSSHHTTELAEKTAFLGTAPLIPTLLKLGVPAAVGLLINALYNVVDTIFVGHGVGSLAVAALSIAFPLQMLVAAFAQALGAGGASVLSRRLGEGRPEDAARVVGSIVTTVALLTLVMSVLVLGFADPILRVFGATETILPFARDYLLVVGIGFVFNGLSMSISSLLQAEGSAKRSMQALILGAVINIVLDPVFIFVVPWGIQGAAFATVISQVCVFAYMVFLYRHKKTHVAVSRSHFRPERSILNEASALGVPGLVQNAGMSVLMIIVNQSLGAYGGDDAITIYGMVNRLMSLGFLPMFGLVQGFQPVAGYNFGAKNYRRVKQALSSALALAFGVMAVVWILFLSIPGLAMGMFTGDGQLADRAGAILRVLILAFPLVGLQVVGATYFQAVGRARPAMILGLSRQFLVLIPLLLILPLFFGLGGIWWAFPISDAAATTLTLVLVIREVSHLESRHQEASAAA